jgi:nucleotide-binding universal stress UspA family protein
MDLPAISKILVPVDFSVNSVNALSLACAVACNHNAAVHLLHVADSDEDIGKPARHDFAGITKKLREFGNSVASTYKINCICVTEYGCVTHLILKKAKQLQADLIVMGKNGAGGPSVLFAGTHTCQVAKKSNIPVLVVPDKIARFSFRHVLFPLRPPDSMLAKYDRMRPFILKQNTLVTILHLRNPQHETELDINQHLSDTIAAKLQADGIFYSLEYYFAGDQFAEKVLKESINPEKKYDLTVIVFDQATAQFGHYEQQLIHHSRTPLLLLRSIDAIVPAAAFNQTIERTN